MLAEALMANSIYVTEIQTYGNLYLQSVADDDAAVLRELDKYGEERPKHLVEPRVYWPPREPSPKLTLDDLIGLENGGDKPVARQGAMSESNNPFVTS